MNTTEPAVYRISNNLALFLNKPLGSIMSKKTLHMEIRKYIKKNNIKKTFGKWGTTYELDDNLKKIFESEYHDHINDFNMH
jgi:hypothetical protein